jgi:hypothetical protein
MMHRPSVPREDHVADLLPEYVNGALDEPAAARVRSHLRRCAICRVERDAWVAVAAATCEWAEFAATPAGGARLDWVLAALDPDRPLQSVGLPGRNRLPGAQNSVAAVAGGRREDNVPTTNLAQMTAGAFRGFGDDHVKRWHVRAWRSGAEVVAAALLVVVLAAGYLAYRAAPGSDDGQPSGPSAAEGTSGATPIAPAAAERRVAPRPAPEFVALLGTPGPGTPYPLAQPPYDLPAGQQADAAAITGITATWREFWACIAANDPERAAALFSDTGLGRIGDPPLAGFLGLSSAPHDYLYQVHPYPYHLIEARILADGRVAAIFDANPPLDASVAGSYAVQYGVVFVRTDDRWLIDELGRATG